MKLVFYDNMENIPLDKNSFTNTYTSGLQTSFLQYLLQYYNSSLCYLFVRVNFLIDILTAKPIPYVRDTGYIFKGYFYIVTIIPGYFYIATIVWYKCKPKYVSLIVLIGYCLFSFVNDIDIVGCCMLHLLYDYVTFAFII